jgi:hypothetical protein
MSGFEDSPSLPTIVFPSSPFSDRQLVTYVQRDLRRDDVKTKTLTDGTNISVNTGYTTRELAKARQLPLYREI